MNPRESGTRMIDPKQVQEIRDSVSEGLNRVVKPLLERVVVMEVPKKIIGGPQDKFCHPDSR